MIANMTVTTFGMATISQISVAVHRTYALTCHPPQCGNTENHGNRCLPRNRAALA